LIKSHALAAIHISHSQFYISTHMYVLEGGREGESHQNSSCPARGVQTPRALSSCTTIRTHRNATNCTHSCTT
jgi:hypothetical protein